MSKRFIDTDIFKKRFIRGLPASYKLLWLYIMCNCDNAGIWYVDEEEAQINVGKESKISLSKALEIFNSDEHRIIPFDNGKKWFILSFVKFQYGELRSTNPAHKSVIEKLQDVENEGLIEISEGAIVVLDRAFEAPMYKDKDKDKDKDKEKDKEKYIEKENKSNQVKKKYGDDVFLTEEEFNKLCSDVGVECTRWCIDKLSNYKLSTGKRYKSDYRTILNWVIDEWKKSHNRLDNSRQSIEAREKQQRDLEFAQYAIEKLNGGVP